MKGGPKYVEEDSCLGSSFASVMKFTSSWPEVSLQSDRAESTDVAVIFNFLSLLLAVLNILHLDLLDFAHIVDVVRVGVGIHCFSDLWSKSSRTK